MIHFVVALPSEAKPLISRFHLKLAAGSNSFKVYEGNRIRLVISGVGKVRSARAVGFLHQFSDSAANQAWINVGVAGHFKRALGEGVLAKKITDQTTGESWRPSIPADAPCPSESILTVEQAERSYSEPWVYDMEASGFYAAASRFSESKFVQCYKVISDNLKSPSENISAALVEDLIQRNLKTIDEIVRSLDLIVTRVRK